MVIVKSLRPRPLNDRLLLAQALRERDPSVAQLLREVYAGPRPTPLRRDPQPEGDNTK